MKQGASGMRSQQLALDPMIRRKFYHFDCKACAEERLFQGYKCLSCGTMRTPAPSFQPDYGDKEKANRMERGAKGRAFTHSIKSARMDYFRRKAEASRAMFEGKK